MTFKIGMKVVCIDDVGQLGSAPYAVEGEVYIISGICDDPDYPLGLRFDELRMEPDAFLFARRFRPAVSPKQQVSFTTGAPRDSRKWDCRRKRVEVVS